jgi:hypothetical protein
MRANDLDGHLDFLLPPASPTQPTAGSILVFLDTRDLINCFEKGRPVDAPTLGEILRAVRGKLVVPITVISELFPGSSVPKPADVARGVALTRHLDYIPHAFIRHATIPWAEISTAHLAWQRGRLDCVEQLRPFVNRFYKTVWKPAPNTLDVIEETDFTRSLDRMPVWEQVSVLASHPEVLRWSGDRRTEAEKVLADDRAAFGSKRGTPDAWEGVVMRELIKLGKREPKGGLKPFVRWLHDHPEIAPGWRLGWDGWEEYRSNLKAAFDDGDYFDYSHISIIPYVTHFTTDAKWRDLLCGRAWKRRLNDGLPAPYFERVFADLGAILKSLE